jgi:integrase
MGGTILEFRGNKKHPIRYAVQVYWNGKAERFWHYPDGAGDPIYERYIAEKLKDKIQSDIDQHNRKRFTFRPEAYKKKSALSLGRYSEQWLKTLTVRKMTKKGYRAAVNHAIAHFGESFDIRGLTLSQLTEFYNALPFAMKTRHNILTAIKTMLKYAYADDQIDKLPAFPVLKQPKPMDTPYLTFEEQQNVLGAIPERHRPIYEMGMEYGFRIEEVRALKWDCISETHITIRRSMPEYELIESTKEEAARVEEITSRARDILRRARLYPSWKGFVFTASKRGAPYDYKFMARTWKSACDQVGISIHMYQGFRHSYCSQLADMGLGIDVIQKSVGHADRRSTERYTRRQRASERRLINESRGQVVEFKKSADSLRTE